MSDAERARQADPVGLREALTLARRAIVQQDSGDIWIEADVLPRIDAALAQPVEPASLPEPGRPRLDPATVAHDKAYMAGLIRGREMERESAQPVEPGSLLGVDIEAAIGAVCPLVNPRLSEVDWDAVAVELQ